MTDARLFKILYCLLDRDRTTAPELAAELEVSTRTIYRDIEALSGAGIPVYAEAGRNGGIGLLHDFVLDRTVFSKQERQDILTAMQSISATGYAGGSDTLAKLSALFHAPAENWLEVDFSRWGHPIRDNEKFEALKTAVIRHREVQIAYTNTTGEKSERTVQPLKLAYKSKAWYLKAFCLQKQDFRLFKLNRISSLTVLERAFVPKPYPPEERFPQTVQRVVLLFAGESACRVYDEFDEAQMERQPNGDLAVCAEMPVDAWLVGYLLSFGTQVRVVEPASLREALAAQAREIYEKNKP